MALTAAKRTSPRSCRNCGLPNGGGVALKGNEHEIDRYPVRLGEDVFDTGYISEAKQEKFFKFLHALKLLIEVHEVAGYQF